MERGGEVERPIWKVAEVSSCGEGHVRLFAAETAHDSIDCVGNLERAVAVTRHASPKRKSLEEGETS